MAALYLLIPGGVYRRRKASWEDQTSPEKGFSSDYACASELGGTLHLVGWLDSDILSETSRRPAELTARELEPSPAMWKPWAAAESESDPDIRPLRHIAAAATAQGDLHIVAVTYGGSLWYTTKFADDTWLPTWLGDFPSPDIRPITDVACACSPSGDLIVCALSTKGRGKLHYAIRSPGGDWSERWLTDFPGPDIRPIAHRTEWDSWWRWDVRPVACAVAPTGELHVCVIAQTGELHHAVRDSSGTWQPFQKVDKATSGLDQALGSVAMVFEPGGDLHVAVSTRLPDDGHPEPGQVWYVKIPAGGDFGSFERVHARAYGVVVPLTEVRAIGIGYSEW